MPRGKKGTGRPKCRSRATRRDDAASALNAAAAVARELAGELRDLLLEEPKVGWDAARDALEKAGSKQPDIDSEKSELEELRDEMGSWRDSIPENLQGSDKYQQVEEAHDGLDACVCALDSLDEVDFSFDAESDDAAEKLEEIASALDGWADEVESQAADAENVWFPGMFG